MDTYTTVFFINLLLIVYTAIIDRKYFNNKMINNPVGELLVSGWAFATMASFPMIIIYNIVRW